MTTFPRSRSARREAYVRERAFTEASIQREACARIRDAVARALLANPEAGLAAAEEAAAAALGWGIEYVRAALGAHS